MKIKCSNHTSCTFSDGREYGDFNPRLCYLGLEIRGDGKRLVSFRAKREISQSALAEFLREILPTLRFVRMTTDERSESRGKLA